MSIFGPAVAHGDVLRTCVEPEVVPGGKRRMVTQFNVITQEAFTEDNALQDADDPIGRGGVFEIDGRCYNRESLIRRFSSPVSWKETVGGVPVEQGGWVSALHDGRETYENTLPDTRLPVSLAVRAEVFGDALDPARPSLLLNKYHAQNAVPLKPEEEEEEEEEEESAFVSACRRGDAVAVNTLGRELDSAARNEKKSLGLRLAADNGHYNVVQSLILFGDANIAAMKTQALRFAAERGHIDIVRLLLDHGADIHAKDDQALRKASYSGHENVVQLLLEKGADIRRIDLPRYDIHSTERIWIGFEEAPDFFSAVFDLLEHFEEDDTGRPIARDFVDIVRNGPDPVLRVTGFEDVFESQELTWRFATEEFILRSTNIGYVSEANKDKQWDPIGVVPEFNQYFSAKQLIYHIIRVRSRYADSMPTIKKLRLLRWVFEKDYEGGLQLDVHLGDNYAMQLAESQSPQEVEVINMLARLSTRNA